MAFYVTLWIQIRLLVYNRYSSFCFCKKHRSFSFWAWVIVSKPKKNTFFLTSQTCFPLVVWTTIDKARLWSMRHVDDRSEISAYWYIWRPIHSNEWLKLKLFGSDSYFKKNKSITESLQILLDGLWYWNRSSRSLVYKAVGIGFSACFLCCSNPYIEFRI